MEPYNALLATHWLLDHTDVSLIFDNRQIHKLCKSHLGIRSPDYKDLNSLIAKVESATTVSLRFEGDSKCIILKMNTDNLENSLACREYILNFFFKKSFISLIDE